MTLEDKPDPTKPLREVLDEEQVEFLRNHSGDIPLEQLLDQSLKDILGSDDEPDVGELLDRL